MGITLEYKGNVAGMVEVYRPNDGPFFAEKSEDFGWKILGEEGDRHWMLVFIRLHQEQAIEFCDRLNAIVKRWESAKTRKECN